MTKVLIIDAFIAVIVCIIGILVIYSSSPDAMSGVSADISSFASRILGK